ncbi:MAG: signal peptidase II [Anaerolineae bacterium]|nr:signal peptidase II [Anaerolineae bacterium]
MKKLLRSYLYLIAITLLLIALDQYTKFLVTSNLALGESYCLIDSLCPTFQIVHWYNTGVAFGLFQGNSAFFVVVNSIVVVAILIFYSAIPQRDWLLKLALIFETGGAIGNLIDRIRLGHVTDFFAVGSFPVFNIADACINIGVALMLLSVFLEDRKRRLGTPVAAEDAAASLDEESVDLAAGIDEPQHEVLAADEACD